MVDHDTLNEAYARAGFMLYPSAYPGKHFRLDSDHVHAWWHTGQIGWVFLLFDCLVRVDVLREAKVS